MKYNMELHHGDDNDNSIYSFTMEADSVDALFDKLEEDFRADFAGDDSYVIVDGDDTYLGMMWADQGFGDDGQGRMFHHDYYIVQE